MIFQRPSFFVALTDDSNPKFQCVNKKSVHTETYNGFWLIFIPISQKVSPFKIENSPLLFLFICSIIRKLHIQLACCQINNTTHLLQNNSW